MKIEKKKTVAIKGMDGIVIPVFIKTSRNEILKKYPEVELFLKKYKFHRVSFFTSTKVPPPETAKN